MNPAEWQSFLFHGGNPAFKWQARLVAAVALAGLLSAASLWAADEPSLRKCAVIITEIPSADKSPRPLRIVEHNPATFTNCRLRGITVSNRGQLTATESTPDGMAWSPR